MTELVFILDRSGSMSGLEKDTIGGFNSMIERQKRESSKRSEVAGKVEPDLAGSGLESQSVPAEVSGAAGDNALVTTILFDSTSETVHDRLPLGQVPLMTEKEYFAGGCTALLDAVGGAIDHVKNIHKYARKEDVPARTLFVITTDGYENVSKVYDYEKVRSMIEEQKAKHGWEFMFLGANIDATAEAARFGISAENAVEYRCDERGTALNYEAIGDVVSCVRSCAPIDRKWKMRIEEDMKKRR